MVSGEPVLVIGLVVGWTGSSVVEGEYHAPPCDEGRSMVGA